MVLNRRVSFTWQAMFQLGLKKSRNPFRTFIFGDEESLCISTCGRRFRTYIHTYLY